jgi:hypothetical protein
MWKDWLDDTPMDLGVDFFDLVTVVEEIRVQRNLVE